MEASTDAAFSDVSVQTAAAAMGAVALDEVGASGLPHLPLELLSMVLSSSLGQCCRQLCTGLRDEFDSAQRGPLTLIARRRPPSSAIRALVTRCPRLRRVSLRSCADSVDDALLAFVLSALPELCTIDVSFCPLLTARVSLTALRGFRSGRNGDWTADACFWTPSPLLTPEMVVSNQVHALRQNDDEGVARCVRAPAQHSVHFIGHARTQPITHTQTPDH